jgi:hypothetical protein
VTCDATLIPVVTGQIDVGVLDELVQLCLHYAGHGPHCGAGHNESPDPVGGPVEDPSGGDDLRPADPHPPQAIEMLRHAIILRDQHCRWAGRYFL